ncbi:MAG TPA: 30S ribosomal protein S12 methylthiotransferase RimO [Prolixibacteraceae bacterium]|nr:30S ribosomal protein S12 methylthiotransferase RimO [Prolixibacteraceae bacterium]
MEVSIMSIKKINVVTLGCSKNLVDSEHLLRQFEANGLEVSHDSDEPADAVIINTCGFILDAKEESISTIMDYITAKERGDIEKIYVMGCLSARYKDDLVKEIPEVDRFFGKFDFDEILKELNIQKRKDLLFDRHLTTPSHFAYLKIAEGCNRTCAFCAIPQFTGNYVSVPMESLIDEAEKLAQKGVKELLLIAQDLSFYGYDLYKKSALAELVNRLSAIDGIEWIRLHYAYPNKFPTDVLTVMRENPKVCKYLDIPVQHCSDNILARMRRNTTADETRALITHIRQEVPGIALRTTLLVGFPGETEDDFKQLTAFVKEMKFDRLGVFPYSHEDDTYAFTQYTDDIPQEIKQERADEIMEIQQSISESLMQQKVGQTINVLIDREEDEHYVGRTEWDSPEVDGEVLVPVSAQLEIGQFYKVKINSAFMFDLYGDVI